MVSVGLFTNLKSGQNRIDFQRYGQNRRISKFRTIIGDHGKVYTTGDTKEYLTDLETKVQEAYKDKPDIIAIDGGDGTVSTVLTAISRYWQEPPPVAVIAGGTFNVLARRLNAKKPPKYLQNIVNSEDINKLTVRGINMMNVYDDYNNHLSFSAGVGLPVDLLEEVYAKKHLKYLRVALMALRMVGSAIIDGGYCQRFNQKKRLNIIAQGHNGEIVQEENWLGVMAQSIETLGIPSFLPQPKLFRKAETENRFHAVGTILDFRKLLQYLPAIYSGAAPSFTNELTEETTPVFALNHQLKEIRIQSEEAFKYQFNGELTFGKHRCRTRELYITAGKNVNFIADDF